MTGLQRLTEKGRKEGKKQEKKEDISLEDIKTKIDELATINRFKGFIEAFIETKKLAKKKVLEDLIKQGILTKEQAKKA